MSHWTFLWVVFSRFRIKDPVANPLSGVRKAILCKCIKFASCSSSRRCRHFFCSQSACCDWSVATGYDLVGQRYSHGYVRLWEVASAAINRALEPILVHFVDQLNNVIFLQNESLIKWGFLNAKTNLPWIQVLLDSLAQNRRGRCSRDHWASGRPVSGQGTASEMARAMLKGIIVNILDKIINK